MSFNLSTTALGAFAKLCEIRGDIDQAQQYRKIAREFAERWVKEAADGDHFKLAFDRPGTWSQKYNLIWDRILDSRKTYTKLDWILWTATLTRNRADFDALVNPVFQFLNAAPDRSPMTDWYATKSARKVGFTARPVVGGVFAPMLYSRETWQKWAAREKTKARNWAAMPEWKAPVVVAPTAREAEVAWKYTLSEPAGDWFSPEFDASSWKEGPGGFGTRGTPGAVVRSEWRTPRIWLRREITLDRKDLKDLGLLVHHDEDFELYVNGVLAAKRSGYTTDYDEIPLSAAARKALKTGRNVIAIHCRQTGGGQYIDAGLARQQR